MSRRTRRRRAEARYGPEVGTTYLLHFVDPATGLPARYKHAGHYIGKPESSRFLKARSPAGGREFEQLGPTRPVDLWTFRAILPSWGSQWQIPQFLGPFVGSLLQFGCREPKINGMPPRCPLVVAGPWGSCFEGNVDPEYEARRSRAQREGQHGLDERQL